MIVETPYVGWLYVRDVLDRHPGVRLAGAVAPDGAVRAAEQIRPAVIFVGAGERAGDSLGLVRKLEACGLPSRVVMFSERIYSELVTELRAGRIAGHMLWDEVTEAKLRTGIDAVLAGHRLIGPALLAAWAQHAEEESRASLMRLSGLEELVLLGLLADRTEGRIAEDARVSERTVRLAVARLKGKFGCHTLAGLTSAAWERGHRPSADALRRG